MISRCKNSPECAHRHQHTVGVIIEKCLVSPYDGQPYKLIDAEREFIRHAFQLDSDGRLKFPLWVYSAIKKSRKTEFAALLMPTLLLLYGGKYAEGFIVANDLGQAIDRVFSAVKRICQASPLLRNEFTATQDKIVFPATSTTIRALACSPDGIAGGHPTIYTFDEAWTFSERAERMFHQLIPVPSRKVSCPLVTSHAGFSEGLLFDLYQRAQRLPVVGKDLYAGNGLLCFWNHEPLHPWQTEKWLEEMRRELPADEFARMIENHFVSSSSNFITPEQWDACVTLSASPQCHPHMPVMIGLDVATKRDSTAIVVVNGEKDNGVRVDDHKILLPAPGQPVDLERVEQVLLDYKNKYPNCTIIYDPHEMELMAQRLKRLGVRTEEFPQTPSALSALTQNLYDLIRY